MIEMHRNHTRQALKLGRKGLCRWSDARLRATPRTHEDNSEWIAFRLAFFVSEVRRSRAVVPLANVYRASAAAGATDALVPCCPASSIIVLETAARPEKRRFWCTIRVSWRHPQLSNNSHPRTLYVRRRTIEFEKRHSGFGTATEYVNTP